MENSEAKGPETADTVTAGNEALLDAGAGTPPANGAATAAPAPESEKGPGKEGPAAEKKAEQGDGALLNPDAEEAAAKGAPEAYETFTMPEGFTLEGEELEKATGLFRELDLNQEQAQKLVNEYTERMLAAKEASLAELTAKRREWRESVRSRPDFASERALARKGMAAVITDADEKELFRDSWLSDHPALWKVFVKVGRLVSEDRIPKGAGAEEDASNNNLRRFPVA